MAELQVAGPALAASGGSLLSRIRRLLSPVPEKRGFPPIAGLASGIVLASVVVAMTVGPPSTGIAGVENPGDTKAPQDGPRIQVVPGETVTVCCSPVDHIFVTGKTWLAERAHDHGITEATLDIRDLAGKFNSPFCRVTVRDRNGGRAWSNPIWF